MNRVLRRANELNNHWPLDANNTDAALAARFFPTSHQDISARPMPNYELIHKELMLLSAMSNAFWSQLQNQRYKEVDFAEQFVLLVDIEHNIRKSNRLRRLIKGSAFDQPTASIMDINYISGRKFNEDLINLWQHASI